MGKGRDDFQKIADPATPSPEPDVQILKGELELKVAEQQYRSVSQDIKARKITAWVLSFACVSI